MTPQQQQLAASIASLQAELAAQQPIAAYRQTLAARWNATWQEAELARTSADRVQALQNTIAALQLQLNRGG
ncbi:hypothetical protein [Paraburkholderia sediminicola]|uniref:hypothetical protein n=1 Tax=Paraburkholderia sediminicola TaxID=458836 RepID=UPI0038B94194